MKGIFLQIFLISLFSAVVMTAIILYLIPAPEKYSIDKTSAAAVGKTKGLVFYEDLNNDGWSEQIISFVNTSNSAALRISTRFGLLDQINFRGSFGQKALQPRVFFGDWNRNGQKEIYQLLYDRDSLFLTWVEPLLDRDPKTVHVMLMNLGLRDTSDVYLYLGPMHDLNSDGYPELMMRIIAGHSMQPRLIGAYDFRNDQFSATDSAGAVYNAMIFTDQDIDGFSEIIVGTSAYGNFHGKEHSVPYPDTCSYLMKFDHRMRMIGEPVSIGGFNSGLQLYGPIGQPPGKIVVLHNNGSDDDRFQPSLMMFDDRLNLLDELNFPKGIEYKLLSFDGSSLQGICVQTVKNLVVVYDQNFEVLKELKVPDDFYFSSFLMHVDFIPGGELEFVAPDPLREFVVVFDNNIHEVMRFPVNSAEAFALENVCIIYQGREPPSLMIQSGGKFEIFSYGINKAYSSFPWIRLAVFLLNLMFFLFIFRVQQRMFQRRRKAEKQLIELQIKAIKNQVDPHFTLNAVNTISGMALKGEKEKMARFAADYGNLMRKMLSSSDKIQSTLREELEFNRIYLDLQRARYNDVFEYSIEQDETVDPDFLIPRTLLHTFVENAVKHGISALEKGGVIAIRVRHLTGKLVMEVENNGAGRRNEQTSVIYGNTGKGLEIVGRILELYGKLYKTEITWEMSDLRTPDGQDAGLKVSIFIPVH